MFEESFDYERVTGGETELSIMRRIDWDRRSFQRLIAGNQATTSDLTRRGPSQLSQAILELAGVATRNNASQSR